MPKWYRVDSQAATMLRHIKAFSMILGPCLKQQNETRGITHTYPWYPWYPGYPWSYHWAMLHHFSILRHQTWALYKLSNLIEVSSIRDCWGLTSRLLHLLNLETCSSSDPNKWAKQAKDRNLAIVHASHRLRSGECGLRLDEFTGSLNHLECGKTNHDIQHQCYYSRLTLIVSLQMQTKYT